MVMSRCKVDLFCIRGFSELAVILRLETKAVGCRCNFNEVTETLFITPLHILPLGANSAYWITINIGSK